MRNKDKIIAEMTINDDRIVIVENKSNHIIRYAKTAKAHFYKKASRVKLDSLHSAIEWLCLRYGDKIRTKLDKLIKAPNLRFKELKSYT